jgi:hypothetical protein
MVSIALHRRRLRNMSLRDLTLAVRALTGATTVQVRGDEIVADARALPDAEVVAVMSELAAAEVGADRRDLSDTEIIVVLQRLIASWATKPRLAAAGLV